MALIKQPAESRMYTVDFSKNLEADENITSVLLVEATPTGLDVGIAVFTNKRVRFRVSGGTHKTSYKLTVRVQTSMLNILEEDFILLVKEII